MAGRTRVVITDANVIINLIHVERLDLLWRLPGYQFVVPPEVEAEVCVPRQAAVLKQALDAGDLSRQGFTGTAELGIYAELVQVLGKGESACLAMAEVRGWLVASDEGRRFLRLANAHLGPGRVLNTPGLFVLAIRADVLTVEEADRHKATLERHRFKMNFASFRDVYQSEE